MDKKTFRWTEEAASAFCTLKMVLAELPTLTSPIPYKVLTMYLAVSITKTSALLVENREDKQVPIYFVSRILQGAEMGYSDMEKLALCLVNATRRLRRYFLAHTIEVFTNISLHQVLFKPEKSGRLAKCAMELGENEIVFKPRTSIKVQALVYFITEIAGKREVSSVLKSDINTKDINATQENQLTLLSDGSYCIKGMGVGLILITPTKEEMTYALRLYFQVSNNKSEYEALIVGLYEI